MKKTNICPKDDFIELMVEMGRQKGLDELSSRILGILFIETEEVSLEELSEITGYSLSSISTVMKFLKRADIVKRIKKPKSKKAYFFMEKDVFNQLNDIMIKKTDHNVTLAKQRLPEIIEKYKVRKSKGSAEELKIVKRYYKQILISEKILLKVKKILLDAKKEFSD